MKIIESSPDRLVARNRGIGGYSGGGIGVLVGIGTVIFGLAHKAPGVWAVGLGVLAVGVLILLTNKSELLTADRASATVSIELKGLTGGKNQQYTFDQISSVTSLQQYQQVNTGNNSNNTGVGFGVGSTGGSQLQLQTTTQLVLADGTSVVIEKITSNANGGMLLSTQSSHGIGEPLATFLGKPYQLVAPNLNPLEMVHDVVAAIRGDASPTTPSVVPGAPAVPSAPVAPASTPEQQPTVPTLNGPGFAAVESPSSPAIEPPIVPTNEPPAPPTAPAE
ncbi:hypothetical protein HJC99_01950 [Candidatus Saccharibacteria bacterium]|nr:hypothetical protein [Candidatus Saccharibacteria bacterium]